MRRQHLNVDKPKGKLHFALHAAMPNSSGGPVLYDSKLLAGTHLGTTFHLDDENAKKTAAVGARLGMTSLGGGRVCVWVGFSVCGGVGFSLFV